MKLNVALSIDDISLVLYRDEKNPLAKLCLSPYSLLKYKINSYRGEDQEKSLYQSFIDIFTFAFYLYLPAISLPMSSFSVFFCNFVSDEFHI